MYNYKLIELFMSNLGSIQYIFFQHFFFSLSNKQVKFKPNFKWTHESWIWNLIYLYMKLYVYIHALIKNEKLIFISYKPSCTLFYICFFSYIEIVMPHQQMSALHKKKNNNKIKSFKKMEKKKKKKKMRALATPSSFFFLFESSNL